MEVLETVKDKFYSFRIIWVDGNKHYEFKEDLEVADGYPQAALISRGKLLLRPYRSAFTTELITEFLEISRQGTAKRIGSLERDPVFSSEKTEL